MPWHLSQPIRLDRFDIRSFDFSDEDEPRMLDSVSCINQFISAEVNSGIDPGRIVVGGFSQGAAMSLLCGLTNERKLGGVVSLSGWLVLKNKIKVVSEPDLSGTSSDLTHLDVFPARGLKFNLLGPWHR